MKRTLIAIIKEFWLPFLLALLWSIYNLYDGNKGIYTFRNMVNIFGPSFFLASWIIGQFFRIRKQQEIQDNFLDIKSRLTSVIDEISARFNHLLNYMSGGNSFCYLRPIINTKNFIMIHEGEFPAYDVNLRIIDRGSGNYLGNVFEIDILRPGLSKFIDYHVDWLSQTHSFNVFIHTRNISYVQMVRTAYNNNRFNYATKVMIGNDVMFYEINDDYPNKDDICWN
ncbi:MAG: hypothetical protein HQL75_09670 [Magnetococcales bacterium]|nr:hypothetical protein [Magnetococcales bacterium]